TKDIINKTRQFANEMMSIFKDPMSVNQLITVLRFVTGAELYKNEEQYAPFIEDFIDMKNFVVREVEPLGIDTDHVQIRALSTAIGIHLRIIYIDSSQLGSYGNSIIDFNEEGELLLNQGNPISMLFTPGHYEVLI
ncbi:MAG: hypothetical protein MHPSP_001962, partial [Paramarteilia canceri]